MHHVPVSTSSSMSLPQQQASQHGNGHHAETAALLSHPSPTGLASATLHFGFNALLVRNISFPSFRSLSVS